MIHLSILTPERKVFSETVEQVSLMTETGEITVLPNHIPLVTILQHGELRYKKHNEEFALAVSGGFAEVRPHNQLVILADSADFATDINVAEAEAARDRALKIMQETINKDSSDYAKLQSVLERELNRLKVGSKYRKLPGA
jgi:F-type H+-transporting ATPase subunit epsilon